MDFDTLQTLTNLHNALGIAAILFVLVLVVLWALLPFSLFGIKTILREMQATQKAGLELRRRQSIRPMESTKTCPDCAEMVLRQAKVCRFCRHDFANNNPPNDPPPEGANQ